MYRLREPAPELRPYIENYWSVSHEPGEEVDLRVEVFVDARADLVFNVGVPYRRVVIGGATVEISASTLDAQRLVPIRIEQRGAVTITGVRFCLGGLAPFTRVRLDRWSGHTPPPRDVLGDEAIDLEAELRASPDLEFSARVLDEFFLARLRRDSAQSAFEEALAALVHAGGRAGLDELAETAGRVVRFQTALRRLMEDPGVTLGDVAADAGYYDQAHFVRDFRLFSGGVPRGYRGYYPEEGPSDFAPNVVVFVQDESELRG